MAYGIKILKSAEFEANILKVQIVFEESLNLGIKHNDRQIAI